MQTFIRLLFLSLCISFQHELYAQLEKMYIPFVFSGAIPAELTVNYKDEYLNFLKLNTELNKDDAEKFYTDLILEKKNLLNSGNLYFNDPFTAYVNQVADRLLKNNLELRKKIKIHVTRYSSVNAFAFPDGGIYVNIGLLAQLKTESQLAFILAHEIAHYEKKHSINSFRKSIEVKTEQYNSYNPLGEFFREMAYSREDEFAADARGVELIASSEYNLEDCVTALSSLNDSLIVVPDIRNKFDNLFNNEVFTIDSSSWDKRKILSDKATNTNIFGSTNEDLFSTHPNIEKRIIAVRELIKLYNRPSVAVNIETQREYDLLKEIALFEMVSNLYKNSYYYSSFYLSVFLSDKYPDNIFLKTYIVKNLYWLSFYTEINNTYAINDRDNYFITETAGYMRVFFMSLDHNQLKKMLYGYAKRNFSEENNNEEYLFFYAMSTELYIGKEAGRILYTKCSFKYPNGEFSKIITNKLK